MNLYAELFHHLQSHINVGHSVASADTGGEILLRQAGGNQQRAEKLAAAVNVYGDFVRSKAAAVECEGKISGVFRVVFDPASKLLQRVQQRGHGPSAHLLRSIHVIDAF